MKRRALLGTLATTAFAGCISGFGGGPADESRDTTDQSTTSDSTTDDTTTTEDTSNGNDATSYALEVAETDPAPVENVAIDVVVTENFTADHPARLRVEFTNTADEQREFQFGSLVPWDGIQGDYQDGEGGLVLAPGDSVVPDQPDGGCWRATDGIALPMVMRSEKLDADETVSQEFYVLAAHDSETCHEPGDYRFQDDGYLDAGWGFTLTVESTE